MEANELRIGNYLLIKNDLAIVDGISKDNGVVLRTIEKPTFSSVEILNIKPIPLTEEWLLKFGFEIIDEVINKCYRKQLFKGDGYMDYLSIIDRGVYIFMLTSNYGKESVLANPPKYVHQLQNLYFALTGEELQTSVVNME